MKIPPNALMRVLKLAQGKRELACRALKRPSDRRKPVETGSDPAALQYTSAYFGWQTPVSTGGGTRLTKFALALKIDRLSLDAQSG